VVTQPSSESARPGETTGGETTRARIVDAARDLFYDHGYHATSLATIQRRAGVHGGSLYHFFKTKEELLVAVLESYRAMLRPLVIEPAFATTDDPLERVFAVLAGYRRMLAETDCRAGCPIGNLANELPDAGGRVQELITANFESWCAAIESVLAEVPGLPEEIDLGELSRFVLTIMEGAVLQARGRRSLRAYDEAVDQLRMLLDRLLARDRPPTSSSTKGVAR
jgi:TetR/AcrR family transcriptional regulator, transcriptional repressor for nem operon